MTLDLQSRQRRGNRPVKPSDHLEESGTANCFPLRELQGCWYIDCRLPQVCLEKATIPDVTARQARSMAARDEEEPATLATVTDPLLEIKETLVMKVGISADSNMLVRQP